MSVVVSGESHSYRSIREEDRYLTVLLSDCNDACDLLSSLVHKLTSVCPFSRVDWYYADRVDMVCVRRVGLLGSAQTSISVQLGMFVQAYTVIFNRVNISCLLYSTIYTVNIFSSLPPLFLFSWHPFSTTYLPPPPPCLPSVTLPL